MTCNPRKDELDFGDGCAPLRLSNKCLACPPAGWGSSPGSELLKSGKTRHRRASTQHATPQDVRRAHAHTRTHRRDRTNPDDVVSRREVVQPWTAMTLDGPSGSISRYPVPLFMVQFQQVLFCTSLCRRGLVRSFGISDPTVSADRSRRRVRALNAPPKHAL